MEQPQEFKQLALDTLSTRLLGLDTEVEIRNYILNNLHASKQRKLQDYLADILDGHCSDADITALWSKTGTDFYFYQPDGTRKYLLKVKEWLSQAESGR